MDGNFGFIHEKLDIKILILFIMRRLPEPVTLDVLTELAMCDDGISYFDFAECVAELVTSEHLLLDEENKYSLTKKGEFSAENTEVNLPYSVRVKAEKSTSTMRTAMNRNAMIKTSHTDNPDGSCMVQLSMSDGVGDIVSIEILAANEKFALGLEKGFRNSAENIYNAIIGLILES